MNDLIGDRFLKRFIGRRLPRQTENPAGEEKYLPENSAAKTAEPEHPPREDLPKKAGSLENKVVGETNQIQNTHE